MLIEDLKAVVFDLDGTLVNTRDGYVVPCVGQTLAKLGVVEDVNRVGSYYHFAKMFWTGVKNRDVLIRQYWGLEPSDFWRTFVTVDSPEKRARSSFAYSDCHVLKEIKDMGLKLGLCTDAPENVAKLEMKLLPVNFDCVVCADDAGRIPSKPDPRGLLSCLRGLGVSNEQVVFIGNADVDIHTARNAKVYGGVVVREPEYGCVNSPDFSVGGLVEFKNRFFG